MFTMFTVKRFLLIKTVMFRYCATGEPNNSGTERMRKDFYWTTKPGKLEQLVM